MSAREVFLRAVEIDDSADRAAYLDDACQGDVSLRRKVEALLAADEDPDSYLERPAAKFDVAETQDSPGSGSNLSDSSSHHGRFLPGTKVADRYRIVSLLGRGGMGEVYRADDLRLGQPVALKFLPPELAKDAKRLEYFHNEVRLARQISHPNVCRVYDIGDVDGQYFISMEYIDGEDLKTLLARIGRLPTDKANEIAQQLCAGLAAAHANKVLHRDLKPANIMIDGQGQVRLTDFGLAATSLDGNSVIGMSGTPSYMAPEQLLKGEATVQSDLYSLGLILFEILSGQAYHAAKSVEELREMHLSSSSSKQLSDLMESIDPATEAAIARCLEKEPTDRPASASALASQLPGGDPLAAALAAGQTPSPELVAAAGDKTEFSPRIGAFLLASVILAAFALLWLSTKVIFVNRLEIRKPGFLVEKANTLLRRFGNRVPNDVAYGFEPRPDDIQYATPTSERMWKGFGKPTTRESGSHGLRFWYRETPGTFFANGIFNRNGFGYIKCRVRNWMPRWTTQGMTGVELDHRGNLVGYRTVPIRRTEEQPQHESPDWLEWFDEDAIGFDLSTLELTDWQRTPRDAFDHYQSWQGTPPGCDEIIYVHAAAYRGKPTMFEILPETLVKPKPDDGRNNIPTDWSSLFAVAFILLGIRNWLSKVGDRKSTIALASYVFVIGLLSFFLQASYCRYISLTFRSAIAFGGAQAIEIALYYIAFEPSIRRFIPRLLISSTRLLRGGVTDSLVGRDLLIGTCVAVLYVFVAAMLKAFEVEPVALPPLGALDSIRVFLGSSLDEHLTAITGNLFLVALILLLRIVLRSSIGAYLLAGALYGSILFLSFQATSTWWGALLLVAWITTAAWMMSKFGVLAFIVASSVLALLTGSPITSDIDSFYFPQGMLALSIVVLLAYWGFYCACGRIPIWRIHDAFSKSPSLQQSFAQFG